MSSQGSNASQINGSQYITLEEAKEQLSIDEGLTIHDSRIMRLIGAAIDWAEGYTQRSLGELMELTDPTDSSAVALPDPVDSPNIWREKHQNLFDQDDPTLDFPFWNADQTRAYWRDNPIRQDQSKSLRRDVKEAILLQIEIMFDRNPETMQTFQERCEDALFPYRIALGVN
jgi:hypothetical protein